MKKQKISSFSIFVSLIFPIVFVLGILVFINPLLVMLGAGKETYEYAYTYAMFVIVIGGVPIIMANVLSYFVRSIGESPKAGFGITLGGIINIILDPIFMFLIMPKGKEIMGAGIATCLPNFISCVYFIYTITKLKNSALGIRKIEIPGNYFEENHIIKFMLVIAIWFNWM